MPSIILRIKNTPLTVKLLLVILAEFTVVSILIAANLKPGIIPDEKAHFGLSEAFATTWGIPADSPSTYAYGPISEHPYFYYWINGRVLNLVGRFFSTYGELAKLIALRFVNVIYSLLTLIFSYLLAREILKDRWWSLLVVFMLANTLMFTFLSSGVSYDNLANLCSIVSIFFLVKVLNHKDFYLNSLLWLIFACLGTLVKFTTVPLAVLEFGIWVFYILKNHKEVFASLALTYRHLILLIVLLVFIGFDESIYGMNLLMYHTITPQCTQILTSDQCNLNPVERRNAQIQSPGRVTASDILKGSYPDPVEYALTFWIPTMISRIHGILGHQSFIPALVASIYMLFYLALAFVIAGNFWKTPFEVGSMLVVTIGYISILFVFNYNTELINGFQHVAIQGRYIFPIIGTGYTLVAFYLSRLRNRIVRNSAFWATATLFLITGPVLILTNYATVFTSWFF